MGEAEGPGEPRCGQDVSCVAEQLQDRSGGSLFQLQSRKGPAVGGEVNPAELGQLLGEPVFSAAGEPRDSREELHAEFEALLLGDRLEIESHAAYLGHWVELLKESPRVLLEVLSEGRQGADLNSAGASPPCVA